MAKAGRMRASARLLHTGILAGLCVLGALRIVTFGADTDYYGVLKAGMFQREAGAAPQLLSSNAFVFAAFVAGASNNAVTNATVTTSSARVPMAVLAPETNGRFWHFTNTFASQAELDAAYPTGSFLRPERYTYTMGTAHDGAQTADLSFSLLGFPLNYPATPKLVNLAEAQATDTTRDFALRWESLGGSALAIVQLTIMDGSSNVVFMTPAPFQPGALNGASTSAVIPAFTLSGGEMLSGHLSIGNPGMPNTGSYPGATGIAALGKDTGFTIRTLPLPPPPQVKAATASGDAFTVQVLGEPGRIYALERSDDLQEWTTVLVTNSPAGAIQYAEAATNGVRLFRARLGRSQ